MNRTEMLLSVVSLNLYALRHHIYGSRFEYVDSERLKVLDEELDSLVKNHKDSNASLLWSICTTQRQIGLTVIKKI